MKYNFNVQGMSCEHCEKAVSRAIRQLDRSADVQIDRAANKVEVDSSESAEVLKQAIVDEGYTVVD
ncbi:cation transporter [Rhodoferax sp.]|uniref:heavy-metal-associated domain-containing protein n=1 Tax=Rhodoferax sp. TaxID=50421 RepID=UPI0026336C7B|nr:cation transporter [Rhodoferax sp.]MDD2923758.1 cation transporter [Rhodoferax sp.]